MNEINNSNPTTPDGPVEVGATAAKSAGTLLKEQRIAAGLSQEVIADKLKLALRQIDALEHDRYDELPGGVFIRGFIRSYARLLNMDPQPLLNYLAQALPQKEPQTILPALHESKEVVYPGARARRARIKSLFIFVVVIIILCAIAGTTIHYLKPSLTENSPADASMVVSSAPLETDEGVEPDASGMTVLPHVQSDAGAQPASAVASIASAPAQVAPGVIVEPATASAVPAGNTLQIKAGEDSWVRVSDANGETLFQGTVKANTTQNLGGKAPYQVRIGNAHYTTLSYDGKNVDLTPYMQGNIATLEVK